MPPGGVLRLEGVAGASSVGRSRSSSPSHERGNGASRRFSPALSKQSQPLAISGPALVGLTDQTSHSRPDRSTNLRCATCPPPCPSRAIHSAASDWAPARARVFAGSEPPPLDRRKEPATSRSVSGPVEARLTLRVWPSAHPCSPFPIPHSRCTILPVETTGNRVGAESLPVVKGT